MQTLGQQRTGEGVHRATDWEERGHADRGEAEELFPAGSDRQDLCASEAAAGGRCEHCRERAGAGGSGGVEGEEGADDPGQEQEVLRRGRRHRAESEGEEYRLHQGETVRARPAETLLAGEEGHRRPDEHELPAPDQRDRAGGGEGQWVRGEGG